MSSRDNGLRCSQHRLFARNFRSFPHFLPYRPLSIESPEFVFQSTTREKGEHGANDRPGPTCNCILDGKRGQLQREERCCGQKISYSVTKGSTRGT